MAINKATASVSPVSYKGDISKDFASKRKNDFKLPTGKRQSYTEQTAR
jgi:hypothetical protein